MTTDDRPVSPTAPHYTSEIRHRAESRIEAEIHNHDARRNVNAGYIIVGAASLAIGVYLIFADPSGLDTGPNGAQPVALETPARQNQSERIVPASPGASQTAAQKSSLARSMAFHTELVEGISRTAQASGMTRINVERLLSSADRPYEDAATLAQEQPELTKSAGEYIGSRASKDRIDAGRRKLVEYAALLSQIEKRFGIDRHILVAIWGIESNYGTETGNRPIVRSLLSLTASDQRRATMWRDELMSALSLLDKGELLPERAFGSWAGALGPMQLMPSSVVRYAVDFDGDNRRDIVGSLPDAFATAANFLKSAGWVEGKIWGREVKLPSNFDFALAAPQITKSVSSWQMLGVRPASGLIPLDDDTSWHIALPAGANGPAFLVSTNFNALMKYNRSMVYAVAVGHLSDRLAGGSPLSATWPIEDVALSMNEIAELQRLLSGLGYDPGTFDGIVGQNTKDAARKYQKARALVPDGHPTLALLRQLRAERRN